MPIRPEFRHLYRGAAWRATRARILHRASNRCEQCAKPNGERIFSATGCTNGAHWMMWRTVGGTWINETGWRAHVLDFVRLADAQVLRRREIRVVLTVAHLNHVPGDDRDDNLRAWCQWCHLMYDREHHRETRQIRKDAARPLLMEATA